MDFDVDVVVVQDCIAEVEFHCARGAHDLQLRWNAPGTRAFERSRTGAQQLGTLLSIHAGRLRHRLRGPSSPWSPSTQNWAVRDSSPWTTYAPVRTFPPRAAASPWGSLDDALEQIGRSRCDR